MFGTGAFGSIPFGAIKPAATAPGGAANVTAAQTLQAPTQSAVATSRVAVTGAQTLASLGHSATAKTIGRVTGAQTTQATTQSATATSPPPRAVTGAQTTLATTQVFSASLSAPARVVSGNQTTSATTQSVTLTSRMAVTGAQTLSASTQSATASVRSTITGAQATLATTQSATASVSAAPTTSYVFVNHAGTWKPATTHVNHAGTWKRPKIFVNDAGTWKEVGGAAVGPPVTIGLKVWIDASQLVGADGSSVSPWLNLVAGGAHGYVVGGAVPPKLKINARNGLSVVHINALEGRFVWDNNTTGVSWPYTVIYVACKTDLRVTTARVVSAVYPPQNLLMGYYTNFDQAYVGYFIGTPRTPVAGEWNMYSMDNDLNGASRFWRNSGALPGGGGGEQHWNGSLVLGGYDPTAVYDAQCPDADYGELLMYDRKLTDAERTQAEDYLRTKWGPF